MRCAGGEAVGAVDRTDACAQHATDDRHWRRQHSALGRGQHRRAGLGRAAGNEQLQQRRRDGTPAGAARPTQRLVGRQECGRERLREPLREEEQELRANASASPFSVRFCRARNAIL